MQLHSFNGKVKEIGETQYFGRTGSFSKRDLIVMDENEAYPNPVKFSFKQDKTSLLDEVKVGDDVVINYFIEGRRWENPQKGVQYFVDLVGYTITPNDIPF